MHHSERRARELLDRLHGSDPIGAEVGVWRGEMSHHLLRLRPDLRLFMVDNWLGKTQRASAYVESRDYLARASARQMAAAKQQAERVTRFAGHRRSIWHADSLEVAGQLEDASLDFVFIDAEHTYEAVRADIAAWTPKLVPGGLLCGHDYSPPGERSKRGWPGVVRAVDEAVAAHGWTLDRGAEATWFVRLPDA